MKKSENLWAQNVKQNNILNGISRIQLKKIEHFQKRINLKMHTIDCYGFRWSLRMLSSHCAQLSNSFRCKVLENNHISNK